MPQIFQVLRCYKCFVFQIHQTKKSNKFECKVCGEKQSVKRHYGIGTGKDCRLHVQRLNSLRGEIEMKSSTLSDYDENELQECKVNEELPENNENSSNETSKKSKWTEFVYNEVKAETRNNESMFLGDKEVVLELPQKRKIKTFKVKTKRVCDIEETSHTLTNISNSELSSEWEESNLDDLKNYESDFQLVSDVKHLQVNKVVNTSQEHPRDMKSKVSNNQNIISNNQKSPYKPDVYTNISKTSKWAQFAEEDENEDPELLKCGLHESTSNTDNLFTLCDDSDLDNVLNI